MKHGVWTLVLVPVIVISLMLAGCNRKQDSGTSSAPAPEKKPATAAVNMNEGQWEITTVVDAPGMPEAAKQPHSVTTCLKKTDYIPRSPQQSDCKILDQKIDGNTVSWEIQCKQATGKGTVTYAGDSFSGLMETTMKEGAREMTVKMKMDGKRIGDCPQK